MKTSITMKGQEVLNFIRRKDKYSEISIELASYTQILK
jgi:protein involved in sex pheromone biosynthesis